MNAIDLPMPEGSLAWSTAPARGREHRPSDRLMVPDAIEGLYQRRVVAWRDPITTTQLCRHTCNYKIIYLIILVVFLITVSVSNFFVVLLSKS
jgi:hypothetical protein